MNIDEAIAHVRQVAEECPSRQCGYQHSELADWLEELKAYRETELTPEDVQDFMGRFRTVAELGGFIKQHDNDGKSDRQIAEAVFVSASMVGDWRRKQGLPANRKAQKKQSAAKTLEPPVSPSMTEPPFSAPPPLMDQSLPKEEGPVALSVDLNNCSFALRAPDLESAARVCAYAGQLLENMAKAAEPVEAE